MTEPAPPPPHPHHSPEDEASTETVATLNPFPDHRDLYLLIAGVLLGLVFSGAVLGNLAPSTYREHFVGGEQWRERIEQMEAEQAEAMRRLSATGATLEAAQAELQADFEHDMARLHGELQRAHQAHLDWLAGLTSALVLAIGAIMVLEVLVSPQPVPNKRMEMPPALSRLISIRYALLALWIALVIAQPAVLGRISMLFVALVIAVALAVAFVPLGRQSPSSRPAT